MDNNEMIAAMILAFFAVVGFIACMLLVLMGIYKLRKMNERDDEMKAAGHDNTYTKLWSEAGLYTYLDMDVANNIDLIKLEMGIGKRTKEDIYHKSILKVLKRGKRPLFSVNAENIKEDNHG